ncbi:MAG: hypothetical protein RXQ93_07780 [Caldisphaera sp.]
MLLYYTLWYCKSKVGSYSSYYKSCPDEDIYDVKFNSIRTIVVCLLSYGFQERKLRKLSNLSAKLFNELNYE